MKKSSLAAFLLLPFSFLAYGCWRLALWYYVKNSKTLESKPQPAPAAPQLIPQQKNTADRNPIGLWQSKQETQTALAKEIPNMKSALDPIKSQASDLLDQAYEIGVNDGVASTQTAPTTTPTTVPESDKIFSQAEMDAAVTTAVASAVESTKADLKAKMQAAIDAYKAAEDADEASLAASIASL